MALLDPYWAPGKVRVRASAPDPLNGVRGHGYIAARNLNPPVQRINHITPEQEEAVANILAASECRAQKRDELKMWLCIQRAALGASQEFLS